MFSYNEYHQSVLSLASSLARKKRKADDNVWIKGIMHFGLYLVIGTTVLMTVELGYAIYQIARLCL